jgi:hypothetical protein
MKISVRLDEAMARQVSELAQLTGQGITVVTRQALAFYHQRLCVDTEPTAPPVATKPKVTDVGQVEGPSPETPETPEVTTAETGIATGVAVNGQAEPPNPETPEATPAATGHRTPHRQSADGATVAVHILTIPFDAQQGHFPDEALKRFLVNKHIKVLRPEFFQLGGQAYWTVWVEYEPLLTVAETGGGREASHTADLDEGQRLLLQRLREWRREKADREGVPVYVIATNTELVEVVRQRPRTLEGLRQIRGFGAKKLKRHGRDILALIQAFYAEPNGATEGGVTSSSGSEPQT